MTGPLRIGVVGYGFMGRAHANAWRRVPNFFPDLARQPVLQVACGRDAGRVRAYADAWGFAAVETDWRALVTREGGDAGDGCVPNDVHAEIAVEALRRGKMVLCEKPLGRSLPEAEAMAAAAKGAGLPTMVWYNYRRVPAVSLARRIVAEERLGRVFHYRAQFLQDWTMAPELPQGGAALWRVGAAGGGGGGRGGVVAAGRGGVGQRGDGRSAGALLRHGDVAERADRAGERHDGDLHQGAAPPGDGTGPAGRDRRRLPGDGAVRERLARPVREHALRAGAQGGEDVRGQRRGRVAAVRPGGGAVSRAVRVPSPGRGEGRGRPQRLAAGPRHQPGAPLHGPLVGAGADGRLRAQLRPRGGGFPGRAG